MMMFSVVRSGSHWPSVQDWGLSSSLSNSSLRSWLECQSDTARMAGEEGGELCQVVSVSVCQCLTGGVRCYGVSVGV